MANDPMYPGWPPMQQQEMHGLNTGQRVVDHGDYPMNFGMTSQQQQQQIGQQQMGYWSALQSTMPNEGRMPFAASVSPNTDSQMISNMNSHTGMNQYPTGMMNRAQQQLVRMPTNSGGVRVIFPSAAANPRSIRPFQPLLGSGKRLITGGGLNPAMIVSPKPGGIIPHESPNSDTASWSMLSSISNDSAYNYQFPPHQQTRIADPSLPGPSSQWISDSALSSARSQVIIMMLNFYTH